MWFHTAIHYIWKPCPLKWQELENLICSKAEHLVFLAMSRPINHLFGSHIQLVVPLNKGIRGRQITYNNVGQCDSINLAVGNQVHAKGVNIENNIRIKGWQTSSVLLVQLEWSSSMVHLGRGNVISVGSHSCWDIMVMWNQLSSYYIQQEALTLPTWPGPSWNGVKQQILGYCAILMDTKLGCLSGSCLNCIIVGLYPVFNVV